MKEHEVWSDSFADKPNAFSDGDEIVMAYTFMDATLAQLAELQLRALDIPHYLADHHFALNENVLGGQRLFVRKQDMEQVAVALQEVIPDPHRGKEDWYKAVRTQQSYRPYFYLTMGLFLVITLGVIVLLIYFLWKG